MAYFEIKLGGETYTDKALAGITFWKGSLLEYDALETTDDNTVYLITQSN